MNRCRLFFQSRLFRPGGGRFGIFLILCIYGLTIHQYANAAEAPQRRAILVAVLGDSDSHIYRDLLNNVKRGGAYHPHTYQWTEVLATLRPEAFDFGEKGVWGSRYGFALIKNWLGFDTKTPPKYDFHYNYSLSGLSCESLLQNSPRQAYWLIGHIKRNKARWADGVIVIKIGINDIGQVEHLVEYAKTGMTLEVRQRVEGCVNHIAGAVRAIREASATARIVLYGIMDNSIFPLPAGVSFDREESAKIRSVLDLFDTGLRQLAERDRNIVFVDDRLWMDSYWPNEGKDRNASRSQLFLGGSAGVSKTKGDHPRNVMLDDGHAGTIANGLWARELIHRLNDSFGFGISPLLDGEIAALADPGGSLGIAPLPPHALLSPTLEVPFDHLEATWEQLPLQLPSFVALDGQGADITASATAWCEDRNGRRLWLFGDGRNLEIRPERFARGRYRLTVSARDASGQNVERSVRLEINGR